MYRVNLQRLRIHHTTNNVFSRFPFSISDAYTILPFDSVRLMPADWSAVNATERLWIRWARPVAGQRNCADSSFVQVNISTNLASRMPSLKSTARLVIAYVKSSSGYWTCFRWDLVIECNRRPKSPSPARQSFDNRCAIWRDDFKVECYALVRKAKTSIVLPQGRDTDRRTIVSSGPEHKSKRRVFAPNVDLASPLQSSL